MFRSLRTWFLVAFVVPSLLLFAAAGTAAYLVTRRILENELGDSLSRVAASAAAQLSADRLLTVEPQDDLNQTRTFRNLLRDLDGVRQAAGVRRAFAVDAAGRVRIDAGGGLPAGAEVPELERDRAELGRVLKGERASSQVLFAGADGRLYKTGYAPIRQGGQVVAFVGVEGTSEFFVPLRRLFQGYLALVGLALAVLGGVALWTERAVSRPLSRLMESALRIGAGDLSTPVRPEPVREIGVLAAELEAMRQALEGRDRQLKMMLAGVAHEVRNPIGGVELFAGLLAEELGKDGEAASHVARIQGELQYLKRIVEDFLAFAREQKLATAPVDAAGLLGLARDLMEGDAAKRRVTVSVSGEPALVEADPNLLLAALANLVKNAIQASPEGGEVTVGGRRAGARYRIQVRDRGAGVAPENREKIFEPFFTTREKGTGLGLPLARKIAEAHRGSLTLSPSPGETAFVLELPIAELRPGVAA